MNSLRRILIVIDPTVPLQPAVERIANLPRPLNADILLLICDYEEPRVATHEAAELCAAFSGAGRLRHNETLERAFAEHAARLCESRTERYHQQLEGLAAQLRQQGLCVETDVRWDYPLHEAIVRKAVDWGADLVVKDTHYHSLLRRSLFSNTDWNLIRTCPTRLLLVKPRAISNAPCILAAVDPLHPRDKAGRLDRQILDSATEFALLLGGQTHVVHSFDVASIIASSTDGLVLPLALPIEAMTESMEKAHTKAVQALATSHNIPPDRVEVIQGYARNVLVNATERLQADVLVMGAVSRRLMERFVIGSTAEAILDQVPCDVLVVKPQAATMEMTARATA
jgi:universal stress protein E